MLSNAVARVRSGDSLQMLYNRYISAYGKFMTFIIFQIGQHNVFVRNILNFGMGGSHSGICELRTRVP